MKRPADLTTRWNLGWRILAAAAFVVVAVSVWLSVPAGWPSAGRFWLLYAGLVAWYIGVSAWGRERIISAQPWSFLVFVLGLVLWAVILPLHPAGFALSAVMFPVTYSHQSVRYAIPLGLALTAMLFLTGSGWKLDLEAGELLGLLLIAASSAMLSLFIHSILTQSETRKRLIQELESARASLAVAERQAGVLAERQRLAQEIHDTVAQGFVGIVTHLEAAEAALGGGDGPVAQHIGKAKAGARESLEEARRLVWDLRPDLRDGSPLAQVLSRHLAEWSARNGVAGETVVTGTIRELDPNRETALLQTAREALNNVGNHARATRVTVTLSYMEDEVALDVHDNGSGVSEPGAAPRGGGFGLKALQERITALRGQLVLESAPGSGTTLTVSLPLGPEA
jgi:signal transduction histidine kinase